MKQLYQLFVDLDCSIVEINPLVVSSDNEVIALDAKINFDSSGLFRHKEIEELRDTNEEEPLETRANAVGLNYIKLDGEIGCMVNGAGLAMATMDITMKAGALPANFLDVGGSASEERIMEAYNIITSDDDVKLILVNLFGGILRCDIAARGIIESFKKYKKSVPMVVVLRGTNSEDAKNILKE